MDIEVYLWVDCKDRFKYLSTQRNSIDRSIRGDVDSIRFEFQVENVNQIFFIPGKINLTDPLTKTYNPLTESLKLTLHIGSQNIYLS